MFSKYPSFVLLACLLLLAAALSGCEGNSAASSQNTAVAIYATNTVVQGLINGTATSKSYTPTPVPIAIQSTATMLHTPELRATMLAGTRTSTPPPSATASTITPHSTEMAGPTMAGPTNIPVTQPPVAALRAGEIDDNKLWDSYLLYRQDFAHKGYVVHNVDVSERYIIDVSDGQQQPVLGAHVRVYGNQALLSDTYTYANGQTLFFPKAHADTAALESFNVVVDKDGQSSQFTLKRGQQTTWAVALSGLQTPQDRPKLDVLFLLDSTGSMEDEIAQLQSNILSISSQIDSLPGQPDVRYGMVIYRDRGDDYITRIYQFTPDVKKFQSDLNGVIAAAGGDNPESVNAALHDAIHGVEWRGDTAVKLVFLVADAPPHLDYPDDFDYAQEMVTATQHGIKIYSLAASGLDTQGEYIFRQLAQYTMGHFIFLTYQEENKGGNDSSVDTSKPGDDTSMTVSKQQYTVELLDKLVLRLIKEELASLSRSKS